ncbi:hypothetical protein TNCV_1307671 [Trichonephila clavipes]|nr:hypothetical protein TNCV_1307671 [Trichonephila clavipes]
MATSTNKTAAFGVKLIHKCMSKHRYIQKTDCLVRFMGWWNPSSKTMKATTLQSMSLVYADKPQTLDHLEDNIRRVIADIRPQMLEKVIENWTSRLDYIRASHMPEIIFKIDEAHFWLNGYVNQQNCRIWSEANPQVYVETPLHPEKLTVWCALWAGGVLLQKR